MIKILIVDDEEIEVQACQYLLNKNFEQVQVVGTAGDGLSAINMAIELEPDIVLMDVQMPVMNGIDAIKVIHNRLPCTKTLVISAHNEFTFAQDAMKFGASNYILKPLRKGEFIKAMEGVIQELQNNKMLIEEKSMLEDKIDNIIPLIEKDLIYHILTGNTNTLNMEKYIHFLGWQVLSGYCMILQFTKSYKEETLYSTINDKNLKKEVYEKVSASLSNKGIHFISDLYDDKLLFFIAIEDGIEEYEARNWSMTLANALLEDIQKNYKIHPVVGIGQIYDGIHEWNQSYIEALHITHVKDFNSYINHYKDMNFDSVKQLKYPVEKEKLLLEFILGCDRNNASIQLHELITWLGNRYYANKQALKSRIFEFVGVLNRNICEGITEDEDIHIIYENLLNRISTFDNEEELFYVRGMLQAYINEIMDLLDSNKKKNYNHVIDKGLSYIKENYTKDISLDKVSKHVGVSTYYFSRLFKEKLDRSFVQYLSEMRIKTAKSMLKTDEYSIKEIAFTVGYTNQAYFGKMFKKYVGMTPTEYQSKYS